RRRRLRRRATYFWLGSESQLGIASCVVPPCCGRAGPGMPSSRDSFRRNRVAPVNSTILSSSPAPTWCFIGNSRNFETRRSGRGKNRAHRVVGDGNAIGHAQARRSPPAEIQIELVLQDPFRKMTHAE